MKTITTLISIFAFQLVAFSQAEQVSVCTINYSETSESFVNENTSVKCREINIMSLPPVTQSLTVLNIEFGMTGAFTFKKDASVELYDNRDVYIEDMLTGKVFDLKTNNSYSFNVNRRVPNRFILHIDNLLMRYAISSK